MSKNPEFEVIITKDGTSTILNKNINETYHSVYGSKSESIHVYINAGFYFFSKKQISIFEMGYGTGLNAVLTLLEATKNKIYTTYVAIEKFPLETEIICQLNFCQEIKNFLEIFAKLSWNEFHRINEFFCIKKIAGDFLNYEFDSMFDLIYYDAFSYDKNPELWTSEIFSKVYKNLNTPGILVTYSSKGIVKKNLISAGFNLERLKGYYKHHMLRAIKN